MSKESCQRMNGHVLRTITIIYLIYCVQWITIKLNCQLINCILCMDSLMTGYQGPHREEQDPRQRHKQTMGHHLEELNRGGRARATGRLRGRRRGTRRTAIRGGT